MAAARLIWAHWHARRLPKVAPGEPCRLVLVAALELPVPILSLPLALTS